jgi:chromosomal replication initiator protein
MTHAIFDTPTNTLNVNYWLAPVQMKKELTTGHVLDAACRVFNIEMYNLLSKRREKSLVRARFISMYIIRNRFRNISLEQIGKIFNRDHTSIMHGLRTIKDELSLPHLKEQCTEEINKVLSLL